MFVTIMAGLVFGVMGHARAADYYKGQVITLLVAVSAGGGVDIWARFLTNNLSRFIPGNPTVVIRNMPAAEGLIAANRPGMQNLTAKPCFVVAIKSSRITC